MSCSLVKSRCAARTDRSSSPASPFLENWQWGEVPRPFASREAMTAEVRALRRQHNFSPDNAIEAVAIALRASVDEAALDTALARLPVQAAGFWATPAR